MKRGAKICLWASALVAALFFCGCAIRLSYRRPYREIVAESGVEEGLVFAVMKAESGFRESAVSEAGAVGLMQLLPATADFVCRKNGLSFVPERLSEGSYNVRLGCLYLRYLLERFPEETALAAYNAGEGTVTKWLKNSEFTDDGVSLSRIPYPETARYVKKVEKYRKNYLFFYH